jgi:hypothetical protein
MVRELLFGVVGLSFWMIIIAPLMMTCLVDLDKSGRAVALVEEWTSERSAQDCEDLFSEADRS